MIVLDTNVLSELLRPAPEQRVLMWLANQASSALFTTTVTRGRFFTEFGYCRLVPAVRVSGMRPGSSSVRTFPVGY
ncbi:hypothetical protein AWB78_07015 [Caballeronia calidae]|uniref:Uncharacterized protein n=1 Tax=Caballeronia calidae TaxID=1777139 RepID=A0A158EDR0_9BURK|nr:hypothetical protein AWB78_07015 [Caballeronia calidae]